MTLLNVTGEHPARAGQPARAVVHVAGGSTEYLRVGRGEVVVLATGDLDSPETRGLMERLQSSFTVLAAVPRLTETMSLARWFTVFLEGLGVETAHLLVHSSLAMPITL